MKALPNSMSDAELVEFIDGWVRLMEREDYAAAFRYVAHDPETHWTPRLLEQVIKNYGDSRAEQRVTLIGAATDITQRKDVSRWALNDSGEFGQIWYDLNIDGVVSDLTATFRLVRDERGEVWVWLEDIHVM